MKKNVSVFYGKKIILVLVCLSLLAAACQKVQLKQEVPSSPDASYKNLPQ